MGDAWVGWLGAGVLAVGAYLLWRYRGALRGTGEKPWAAGLDAPGGEEGVSARAEGAEPAEMAPVVRLNDEAAVVVEVPAPTTSDGIEEERASRSDELTSIIEALIFASPEPLTLKKLLRLLKGKPEQDVEAALLALRADYEQRSGLQMVEVSDGYQICARPEVHEWVRRLLNEKSKQRLSAQALETLAVIAYKQPITGAEVAEIRGVNTSGVVGTLLERQLVKVVGRKGVVGRPFLYATTPEFLNCFGLSALDDLPKVEEMAEALGMKVPAALAAPTPVTEPLPFEDEPEVREATKVSESSAPESVH